MAINRDGATTKPDPPHTGEGRRTCIIVKLFTRRFLTDFCRGKTGAVFLEKSQPNESSELAEILDRHLAPLRNRVAITEASHESLSMVFGAALSRLNDFCK
jgi:hypothetical protein